jgi:hypothetical protein
MLRRGAAHGLDVDVYHHEDQCLEILHRPETDNPIENGKIGEWLVALSGDFCNLPDNYPRYKRQNVEDDNGRRPFITLTRASLGRSTIAKYYNRYTRPCEYGNDCPHDRDPNSCEAVNTRKWSVCPSSLSPHPFLRGSITRHLNEDVPETAVGYRANLSQDILDKHHDQRTKREKMEQRRKYIDNI